MGKTQNQKLEKIFEALNDKTARVITVESDGFSGPEVIVMIIGPYPPKRATENAKTLLRAYRESGTPNTAMGRFAELSSRTAFDLEDLFYALQAGLEAKRYNRQKTKVVNKNIHESKNI